MSGRWKHGDVAIVQWKGFAGVPAIYTERGWIDVDNAEFDGGEDDLAIRRLVVIDPEDAEQVERLVRALVCAAGGEFDDTPEESVAGYMGTALREFANPTPRIEEPTGLGAVVEDADGKPWVRNVDGWWRGETVGHSCTWAAITVVRIISPGVPS